MHKRAGWLAAALLTALGCTPLTTSAPAVPAAKPAGWEQLFNGKDLTGWDTWLGRPYKGKEPVGLNKDPSGVYSVVEADGKPAIRISGEIFGALTSKKEYGDYHLRLEFKWGEKKWPPREKDVRDSGLLYHCVGEHGAQSSFWMQSLEFQIQEHDTGDFWSVAHVIVDVEGMQSKSIGYPIFYKKGGHKLTAGGPGKNPRIIKDGDYEKPSGQWNTLDLWTIGGNSVHVVNGKVVMVLNNSRRIVDGKEEPLIRGKLQLQSEGAEVFYRNIRIRPIERLAEELLK
jgi:hypothetical protein